MEHRNSTVLTSTSTLRTNRRWLLAGVAHEFFHGWNVERIRPRSLEPFDLERANMSGELWLAEGFTQYYGPLTHGARRTRWTSTAFVEEMNGLVASVALNPARLVRSAEEMSQMAAFTDRGGARDRTNWPPDRHLVLRLRRRDCSRARPDAAGTHRRPGVARRLHESDVAGSRRAGRRRARGSSIVRIRSQTQRLVLREVSGDPAFARDFFARFIQGRELADYAMLLQGAGIRLRKSAPGRAWLGDVRFDERSGTVRLASAPPFGSPVYAAGIDVDDEIRQFDGTRVRSFADVTAVVGRRRPGDQVPMVFADRAGRQRTATITLAEDPAFELVPIERDGAALTAAQRTFRERWVN